MAAFEGGNSVEKNPAMQALTAQAACTVWACAVLRNHAHLCVRVHRDDARGFPHAPTTQPGHGTTVRAELPVP